SSSSSSSSSTTLLRPLLVEVFLARARLFLSRSVQSSDTDRELFLSPEFLGLIELEPPAQTRNDSEIRRLCKKYYGVKARLARLYQKKPRCISTCSVSSLAFKRSCIVHIKGCDHSSMPHSKSCPLPRGLCLCDFAVLLSAGDTLYCTIAMCNFQRMQ